MRPNPLLNMLRVNEKTFEKEKEVLATKEDLANVKSDIIKWMFIFWIGQIAVTLAMVYFRK